MATWRVETKRKGKGSVSGLPVLGTLGTRGTARPTIPCLLGQGEHFPLGFDPLKPCMLTLQCHPFNSLSRGVSLLPLGRLQSAAHLPSFTFRSVPECPGGGSRCAGAAGSLGHAGGDGMRRHGRGLWAGGGVLSEGTWLEAREDRAAAACPECAQGVGFVLHAERVPYPETGSPLNQ